MRGLVLAMVLAPVVIDERPVPWRRDPGLRFEDLLHEPSDPFAPPPGRRFLLPPYRVPLDEEPAPPRTIETRRQPPEPAFRYAGATATGPEPR